MLSGYHDRIACFAIGGSNPHTARIPTFLHLDAKKTNFLYFYISTPRKRILIIPFAHTHHFYRAIVQYKIWSYCVCRDSTVTVYDIPSMHVRIKPVPMAIAVYRLSKWIAISISVD